ncbi:MAG: hypothetical protein NVS3B20_06240 [Polyangiales bacterium]
MRKAYLLADPHHEYAMRMVRVLYRKHGLKAICLHRDRKLEAYHRQHYRLPSQMIEATYFLEDQALPQLVERLSARHDIVGVVPYSEQTILLAADLVEQLGIDWNPPHVLRRFRDKFAFKDHLRKHHPDIPMNLSRVVRTIDEVFQGVVPQRYVLKPNDGYGMLQLEFFSKDDPREKLEAFFARANGTTFVMEDFLQGTEYCVNGQVDEAGNVLPIAVLEYERVPANGQPNVYYGKRHVRETTALFHTLADYAKRVMRAAGIVRCPFHMELMLTATGPVLVEVGARLVGSGIAQASNDVHGAPLDVFALAAHYYLFDTPYPNIGINWPHYNLVNLVTHDGIAYAEGVIYAIEGIADVELLPEFNRWVSKPQVGLAVHPTVDLFTKPYALTLMNTDSIERLWAVSEEVRRMIRWNDDASALQRAAVTLSRVKTRAANRARALWSQAQPKTRTNS